MDISKVCSETSQIRAEIDEIWRLQKPGNILNHLKPFYILFVEVFGFAKLLTDHQLHPSSFRTTTKREVDFFRLNIRKCTKSLGKCPKSDLYKIAKIAFQHYSGYSRKPARCEIIPGLLCYNSSNSEVDMYFIS